jgi:hypothetical protein
MNKTKKWGLLCSALLITLILTGCGTNLFEGMVTQPEETNATKILENASTPEEFTKAIEIVDKVLEDPNATNNEKQDAYIVKSEAILGANEVSTLEIFSDVGTMAQNADDSSNKENIFNLIQISASLASVSDAADCINSANAVSVQAITLAGTPALSPSLDANQQMLRGIANSLVVLKIAQTVYSIDEEGEVTPKTGFETPVQQLDGLMDPTGVNHSIAYYGTNAIEAFEAADAFTADQLEQITKLKDLGTKIDDLYTAKVNLDKTYQIIGAREASDPKYDLTKLDAGEALGLEAALKATFKSISS